MKRNLCHEWHYKLVFFLWSNECRYIFLPPVACLSSKFRSRTYTVLYTLDKPQSYWNHLYQHLKIASKGKRIQKGSSLICQKPHRKFLSQEPLAIEQPSETIIALGPFVRRPTSANSGVNCNPGFFIPSFKNLLETIFPILVRTSSDQIASKKIWTAFSFKAFRPEIKFQTNSGLSITTQARWQVAYQISRK